MARPIVRKLAGITFTGVVAYLAIHVPSRRRIRSRRRRIVDQYDEMAADSAFMKDVFAMDAALDGCASDALDLLATL
jgi:type II secretory pathway component PulM